MRYDFDARHERFGTDSEKWDSLSENFGATDIIPLWVADMDFPSPKPVVDALIKRAAHAIFGYPFRTEDYYDSFIAWERKRNGWGIEREWVGYVPGVVCGVGAALMGFTSPGDGVLIMPPVYHPFRNTINAQGRRVVNSPLKLVDGRFEVDFEDLAKKAREARAIILCSPHNPSGRVFTREELLKIEGICRGNDLLVISDEIHSDLVFKGYRHIPFASVTDWSREHTITLMAPSKTFNIAGLVASIYVVPNEHIRRQMARIVRGWMHVSDGNIFGLVASRVAYAEGEEWYLQMMEYLEGNVDCLDEHLRTRVPGIRLIRPEATYIPLIDCRSLGLDDDRLRKFMIEKVKAALNPGVMFGEEGSGFCRINLGTQRSRILEFADNLERAVGELQGQSV